MLINSLLTTLSAADTLPPMTNRTRDSNEVTRVRILDAAVRLALKGGLASVSNTKIGVEIGKTASLVSRHYVNWYPGHPDGGGTEEKPNLYGELLREAMRLDKVRLVESLIEWPKIDKRVIWPADLLRQHKAWHRRRAT